MVLDGFRVEQKRFQLFHFSFFKVRVERAHALLYRRKSDIEPVRRKVLKSEDRFFTELVQVSFHQGGAGGKDFLIGFMLGIVAIAALSMMLVSAV